MTTKNFIIIASTVTLLLLIPLIAMQYTNEVNWGPFDFLIAAVLLFSIGLIIEFLIRAKKPGYRTILAVVLLLLIILFWAELAVGIFGSPFAGD